MRHQCAACQREFYDDSADLPEQDRIYCVFCGAPIALVKPKRGRRDGLPFSSEQPSEGAALGIIKATDPSFPDTLRQFAVPRPVAPLGRPRTAKGGDTLMPVAHLESARPIRSAESGPNARPRRRHAPFLLALLGGFTGGAALALGVAEHGAPPEPASVALPPPPATSPAQPPEPARQPAPAACPTSATAPAPAPAPSASAVVPKSANATLERSWFLERARIHQRAYRLDEAERAYRKVLALAHQDSEALAGLGEVELLRGTLEQADRRFQQALDANAHYLPAKVARADIRWQAGRAEEARDAYRDIVEHYSAEAYPPYVAQRSASASFPDCD